MKKILSLVLIAAALLCLAACGNSNVTPDISDEDLEIIAGVDDIPDADNEIIDDDFVEAENTDTYVAAFYKQSGSAHDGYMITESGKTEKLEQVYGYISYTDDGNYAVWRNNQNVYKKQPAKSKVLISDNAESFYLNDETGLLLVFADDGVYGAPNVSEDLTKISDISKGCYSRSLSDDKTHLAYIADGALCLVDLENLTVKMLVSENVDHTIGELICRSANEIYYIDTDNTRYCWNGTTSVPSEFPSNASGNIMYESPNGKYVIVKDGGFLYKCARNGEDLTDKTELIKFQYGGFFISDDGVAGLWTNGKITVFTEQGPVELGDGNLSGLYYQNCPPCVGDTVYYTDKSDNLIGFNVTSGESTTVAENVLYYHVLNGYCYYVTSDKAMYRLGMSEKSATNPDYMNGTGFVH